MSSNVRVLPLYFVKRKRKHVSKEFHTPFLDSKVMPWQNWKAGKVYIKRFTGHY